MPKPLWIAVEAAIGDSAKVWRFARALLTPPEAPRSPTKQEVATAIGFLVLLWGKVADKRESGNVSDVPPGLLASWAGWEGDPDRFAGAFAMFLEDGKIHDWDTHQGKLIEHRKKERARWHHRRETSSGASAEPPPELHPPNSYSDRTTEQHPPTPRGADAPTVALVAQGNGVAIKQRQRSPPARARTVGQCTERLTAFLTAVSEEAARDVERDEVRSLMVDLSFAYWAKRTRHDTAKLDRKRFSTLRQRLVESSDNVHQILFVVDGALKDDNLMGRRHDSTRKYDQISTLYRDYEQVERLAALGGYEEGKAHPMAVKYLDAVIAHEPASTGAA